MNKRYLYLTLSLSCAAIVVSAAFFAGKAYASDARLDLAVDNIVKAKALLKASDNPGVDPPFNYHRQQALIDLNYALQEIQKAKDYADATAIGK